MLHFFVFQKNQFYKPKILKIVLACILVFQANGVLFSQKENNGMSGAGIATFDFNRDIQDQLPPLDSLMNIARAFSPMLEKFKNYSLAEREKIELARKSWSSNIQIQANYAMGNQSLLLSGSAASDLNQLSNGYRAGINLGLPIYELFTRPNRIKLAQAEAKAAKDQMNEAGLLVDREVAQIYYQLLASFKQMLVTQSFTDKAIISDLLAEKQLEKNQISLADYTRISEIRAGTEGRKYEAEKNFYNAYFSLQIILGVPLETLKR
jgi:outer membrane protein TolC